MKSKKAVLYARSATVKKPGDNNSVDMQMDKLREYARKNDYRVLAIFVDEGESGISAHRPGLQNMIAMLMRRPCSVDVVIISDHARLSRSRILSINLRQKLREIGVSLISVSEPCEKQSEEMVKVMRVIEEMLSEMWTRYL